MNPAINILTFFLVLNSLLFVIAPEMSLTNQLSAVGVDTNTGGLNSDNSEYMAAAQSSQNLNKDVAQNTGFSIFNVVATVWDIIKVVFNFITIPLGLLNAILGSTPGGAAVLIVIGIPISVIYVTSLVRFVFTGG